MKVFKITLPSGDELYTHDWGYATDKIIEYTEDEDYFDLGSKISMEVVEITDEFYNSLERGIL